VTECIANKVEQNPYYCGYDCGAMVSNVLVLGPDGKVFFCAISYPGSWADGTLSACIIAQKQERIGAYDKCDD
jgi:hypothetical protein